MNKLSVWPNWLVKFLEAKMLLCIDLKVLSSKARSSREQVVLMLKVGLGSQS